MSRRSARAGLERARVPHGRGRAAPTAEPTACSSSASSGRGAPVRGERLRPPRDGPHRPDRELDALEQPALREQLGQPPVQERRDPGDRDRGVERRRPVRRSPAAGRGARRARTRRSTRSAVRSARAVSSMPRPQPREHPVGVPLRGVPRVAGHEGGREQGDGAADEPVDAPRPAAARRQLDEEHDRGLGGRRDRDRRAARSAAGRGAGSRTARRRSARRPVPATSSITSARATPTDSPSAVSSTRFGRASRTKPRLLRQTVIASSGTWCPSTKCARE